MFTASDACGGVTPFHEKPDTDVNPENFANPRFLIANCELVLSAAEVLRIANWYYAYILLCAICVCMDLIYAIDFGLSSTHSWHF